MFTKKKEKNLEAKAKAIEFDRWHQATNHPQFYNDRDTFNIWFFEVDQLKKSNSRYTRIKNEVKQLKKKYDFSQIFVEAEYSLDSMASNASNSFKAWLAAHQVSYPMRSSTSYSINDNYHFWFSNFYNRKNQSSYETYCLITKRVKADGFNIKMLTKTDFKELKNPSQKIGLTSLE